MKLKKYTVRIPKDMPKGLNAKEKYAYAREHDLCPTCYFPNDNIPKARCVSCSEIRKHNDKIYRNRKQNDGLCICGSPSEQGKKFCRLCLDKAAETMREVRKSRKGQNKCQTCGVDLDPLVDKDLITGEPLQCSCRRCTDFKNLYPSRRDRRKPPGDFRKLKTWGVQEDHPEKMRLYNAMISHKIGAPQLASKLNVNERSVEGWVFDESRMPSIENQIAVNRFFKEQIFNIDIDYKGE